MSLPTSNQPEQQQPPPRMHSLPAKPSTAHASTESNTAIVSPISHHMQHPLPSPVRATVLPPSPSLPVKPESTSSLPPRPTSSTSSSSTIPTPLTSSSQHQLPNFLPTKPVASSTHDSSSTMIPGTSTSLQQNQVTENNVLLPSPVPPPPTSTTTTMKHEDEREPSLPVPYPFASTSKPIELIDSKRDSFELPSPSKRSMSRGEEEEGENENGIKREEDAGGGDELMRSRSESIPKSREASVASSSHSSEGVRGGRKMTIKDEEEEVEEEESEQRSGSNTPSSHSNVVKGKGKANGEGGGGRGRKGKKVVVEEIEPQLIGHLPSAEEEASASYIEIPNCTYYSKSLGDTPYYDPDNSRCDCTYRPELKGSDTHACGERSGCMNRMLQMECEQGDCRCGGHCQNQRFQNKEYAPIEVVKTEKKGFGVRAMEDFSADTFVYEYVGEVIGPAPFQRKMKEYASEGIKHFYFMALDKEVFIDATKRGGKGRFLNHSCNPNCQVAKWTVGKKMRMGIFAKRDIKKDEELTFNYNVDRYGHLAQECFCGEPNCVGFIGGKTQTDIGGMDDLYIDALGIAEEVEALGLKGTKKKKGKKLDEDFTPTLYPVQYDEVPKVSSAIRQALQTRRILEKLLQRVRMTDDEEVQRQLLRLHGLSLMSNILKEYPKDSEVLILDLEILSKWNFQTRNKIEASKIEDELKKFVDNEDEKIAQLTSDLLASWSELSLGFRIPKAQRDPNEDPTNKRASSFDIEQLSKRARLEQDASLDSNLFDRSTFVRPEANMVKIATPSLVRPRKLPQGWAVQRNEEGREYYVNTLSGATRWDVPTMPAEPPIVKANVTAMMDANALIAEAERAAKEEKEAAERKIAEEKAEKEREREERHRKKKEEKEEREKLQKEKKVLGLFSGVVVSAMSKYRAQFEGDAFKKRAKEVTQILLDKEKKRPSYDTDAYDSLTSDKETKVKVFVKEWVKKLLQRKKDGRSSSSSTPRPSSSSSSKPRPSVSNSNSNSSTSTPKLNGVDIDSPATPQTSSTMLVDSPATQMEIDLPVNGHDKGTSATPPLPATAIPAAVANQLEDLNHSH